MMSFEIILIICIVFLLGVIAFLCLKIGCNKSNIFNYPNSRHSTMTVVYDGLLNIVEIINPNDVLLFYAPISKIIGVNIKDVTKCIEPCYSEQIETVKNNIIEAYKSKKNQYFEYSVTQKNGKLLYAICVVEYVNDDRIYCHLINIDSNLFNKTRQNFVHGVFDSLSDNTEIGIYIRSLNDNDRQYVLFNNVTHKLFETEDVLSSKYWNQAREDAEDELCLKSVEPMVFDREIICSDGVKHFLQVTKRLMHTKDGYHYINATMTDITELKNKSEVLENTVLNLDMAIKIAKASVWKYDIDSQIFTIINGSYRISLDECVRRIHANYRSQFTNTLNNLIAGTKKSDSVEFFFVKPNNSIIGRFISEMAAVKDSTGAVSHIIGSIRDITEEYNLRKEIKDNLRTLNVIYDNTPIGLAFFNKDGYMTKMNNAFYSILGKENRYNNSERKISIFEDKFIPESIKESLRNGIEVNDVFEFKVSDFENYRSDEYLKNHLILYFDIRIVVLKSTTGDIEGYVSICSDITEVTEKNKQMANIYKQQDIILEMLPVGVELYNTDGWLVYQNQMAQNLFGCGDLTNKVNILQNPNMPSDIKERSARGEDISFEMKFDFSKIAQSGHYDTAYKDTYKYIKISSKAIKDETGEILRYAAIITDTTESVESRKRIEENILKLNMIIENSAIAPWDYDSKKQIFVPYELEKNKQKSTNLENYINKVKTHPDDQAQINRCIDIMNNGRDERFSIDIRYKWKDDPKENGWRFGTLASEPFERDDLGGVNKYIGFLKDTTQWHKLTEELEQLNIQNQLILNNTQSGFVYFTPDYKILWENVSTAYPNYDISNIYKVGSTCYKEIKGSDDPCENCVVPLAIKTKEVQSQEVSLSENIYTELIATPALNSKGELEGVVMRVDDITERKRINMELHKAKEKAEQSNHLKSAFLANMSHEIRTPLNAIIGFSNIITETDDEQEITEYRKIISTNSDILLNLINDILDLSKVEAGYLEIIPTTIDISEMFSDFEVSFAKRMKEGIELKCINPYEKCLTFGMDKQRVLQVMTNFLSNAVKFTHSGSITLGYECFEDNNRIKLFVTDTGIGISEENCNKIFQRFQKIDSFVQGTGLGLSICKAMVDAMGGRVGFESKEGVGSTFWAKIPCEFKSLKKRIDFIEDVIEQEPV